MSNPGLNDIVRRNVDFGPYFLPKSGVLDLNLTDSVRTGEEESVFRTSFKLVGRHKEFIDVLGSDQGPETK